MDRFLVDWAEQPDDYSKWMWTGSRSERKFKEIQQLPSWHGLSIEKSLGLDEVPKGHFYLVLLNNDEPLTRTLPLTVETVDRGEKVVHFKRVELRALGLVTHHMLMNGFGKILRHVPFPGGAVNVTDQDTLRLTITATFSELKYG